MHVFDKLSHWALTADVYPVGGRRWTFATRCDVSSHFYWGKTVIFYSKNIFSSRLAAKVRNSRSSNNIMLTLTYLGPSVIMWSQCLCSFVVKKKEVPHSFYSQFWNTHIEAYRYLIISNLDWRIFASFW